MKQSSLLILPSSSIKLPRCVRRLLSAHPSQSDCRPRLRSACESPRRFPLTANSSLGTSFMLLRDLESPDAFGRHLLDTAHVVQASFDQSPRTVTDRVACRTRQSPILGTVLDAQWTLRLNFHWLVHRLVCRCLFRRLRSIALN